MNLDEMKPTAFEKGPVRYIVKNFGIITALITACSYIFEKTYLETLKVEKICPPLSFLDYLNNFMDWVPFLLGPLLLSFFVFAGLKMVKEITQNYGIKGVFLKYAIYTIMIVASVYLTFDSMRNKNYDINHPSWGLVGICAFLILVVDKVRNAEVKNRVILYSLGFLLTIILFGAFGRLAAEKDLAQPRNLSLVSMKFNNKSFSCNVLRVYDKFTVISYPPNDQIQIVRTDELAVIEKTSSTKKAP
jgi:hypothetical protein